MVRIKYDQNIMNLMGMFGRITRITPKDVFEDELTKQYVFVVDNGTASRAIGKQGANVKKLENLLKKKIRIVEYTENVVQFIKNLIYPLKIKDGADVDGVVELEAVDHKTRGYIIGRQASHLRNLEKNVQRFFKIKEIKVM